MQTAAPQTAAPLTQAGARAVSDVLPVSYAVEAIQRVTQHADVGGTLLRDITVITGCVALALGGGAATPRRRTA